MRAASERLPMPCPCAKTCLVHCLAASLTPPPLLSPCLNPPIPGSHSLRQQRGRPFSLRGGRIRCGYVGIMLSPFVGSIAGWPGRSLIDMAVQALQPEKPFSTCCNWQANGPTASGSTCGAENDLSLQDISWQALNNSDLSLWTVPEGTERVLRIRGNHGSSGFFAYVLFAINQLILAHEAHITPYIDFGECTVNGHDHPTSGGRNLYYDERYGTNMWEYYFEPVSAYRPSATADASSGARVQYDVRSLSSAQLWDVHHRKASSSVFAYPYGMYAKVYEHGFNETWSRMMHDRAATAVRRYLRVKPAVEAKVEAFWNERVAPGSQVLGVHIRGTDKQMSIGGRVMGPEFYFPAIERWSHTHPGSKIFVASDSPSFVRQMVSKYKDRVFVRNVLRSEKNAFLDTSLRDNYRKGEDVLIDVLLLSKCSFLLKSASSVSQFATYFNPALVDRSIDVQYPREALTVQPVSGSLSQQKLTARPAILLIAPTHGPTDFTTEKQLTRLRSVIDFVECQTSLLRRRGVEPSSSLDARCAAASGHFTHARSKLMASLGPLVLHAEQVFADLAADMPIRAGMANPKQVDLSPAAVSAHLDATSQTAQRLSLDTPATVDLVISRCTEEIDPWLPRLISHFPHDVQVKVVIAELCAGRCVKMAGSHSSGTAPAGAPPGLAEACVSPRQRSVLGANVVHFINPDVGYESAGYLKYIVDTYKTRSFADSTLFLQAGWQVHSPKMLDSNVLENQMSTSTFSMYAPLYEMLPQKGCTDWCLAGTVWKHTLPERPDGLANSGLVGNAAYGLFHAKREAIEKRSLDDWELAYRALIGKHEPLNRDLCDPLQRFNINMSSLMDTPYGKDLIRLIRGGFGHHGDADSIDTKKMVARLGTWLDLDNRQNIVEDQGFLTGRKRLAQEIRKGSPLCFANKAVLHCERGFTLGVEACDPEYMISEQMLTLDTRDGSKAWPCCDMHGGADGVDQALLSLHTRILYCAATSAADKGKLMGVAYEHSWHMLFGEPQVLALAKAPLMNTMADDVPAFTNCPEKDSMAMPTTDTATRMSAHEMHVRNVVYRLIRAGLQVL